VQGDREALHLLDIDYQPSAANSIDGVYPTVRGLPPGRHLVRLVPARAERVHPQASVSLHGYSDTKF
jgi:hypothetical protein